MMIFLSQTRDGLGAVMQVVGTESIPISTRALDFELAQYAANNQISDCTSFLVRDNGIIFYRMNFTKANHTFVYDVTLSNPGSDETKLWHEEEDVFGNRHFTQTDAYFNGMNYVGHYSKPILYILDSNAFTNDGQMIPRIRITKAFVPPGYQRMRIDRLQIDLLQGNAADIQTEFADVDILTEDNSMLLDEDTVPLITEEGVYFENPQPLYIFLSISKDGGQTYGYQIKSPMGKVGERTYRTLWRKLGTIPRGQAFVVKFQFFQKIPFVILGASWAVEILPE
jgi:hypothetical protein